MDNEIKKVISVDLGNTTTSLKEYKKHIDELRGSLLQLDATSEEYQKIAQEIAAEQNKLNEVMKVGKGVTDAADGSYDKLVQTMAELKKQWRATADEAERDKLGQQILEINTKLKELDASTGNFQRNVGDYANAFEQAFDKCLGGLKNLDGPLGEVAGTVKEMLPVIKSINTTALEGLTGIKKGIKGTGIGLIVVAVGLLAQHWEEVKKTVSSLNPITRRYYELIDATEKKVAGIKKQWNLVNIAQETHLEMMEAQGASTLEQLEYIRDNSKQRLKDLEEANAGLVKAMEDAQKMIANGAKPEDLFGGQYEARLIEYNEYGRQHLELTKQISDAEWKITLEQVKQTAAAKKAAEAEEKERLKQQKENAKQLAKEKARQNEAEKKQAENILKRIKTGNQTELEQLKDKYEEEKKLLEKHGKDTVGLTAEYEKNRKKIIQEQEADIQEIEDKRYENIKKRYDDEAEQLEFEAELTITKEQELADKKYEIEQNLIERKIALQQQYIEEYNGTQEGMIEAEEELAALRLQLSNSKRQQEKDDADYAKKMAKKEKSDKEKALKGTLSVASSVFGALSDLMEEGSEEQKAFAIMETTIATLSGAIEAYKSMAGIPYVGPALGIAAAAAVTAAGIANIQKIRSTTKESGGSASVAAPTVQEPSMAAVSPLLDETNDLNRMTTLSEQGDSTRDTQNVRVYVVEQDIIDATHRVNVVENNATF